MSSQLYDGAASVGKFEGTFKLYIAGALSILLVLISLYMFATNNSNLVNTTGQVTSVSCPPSGDCDIHLSYKINGTIYNGSINTSQGNFKVGSNIDITYDSTKPANITLQQKSNISLSIISLICACIIFGGAYLNYYLTTKYKMFAAVEGADTVFKIL